MMEVGYVPAYAIWDAVGAQDATIVDQAAAPEGRWVAKSRTGALLGAGQKGDLRMQGRDKGKQVRLRARVCL